MKRHIPRIAFLLAVLVLGSSCSMLTAQGRRERAYAKYVRKFSHRAQKQKVKFRHSAPAIPPVQEESPTIEMRAEVTPQALTTAAATTE